MALSDDARAIAHEARSASAQLRRMIGKLLNPFRTASALFYGADGQLKPEAIAWFGALAARNFIDRSTFDPDPRINDMNQGRRELMIEILDSVRLDTAKLAKLQRQLREVGDD
jgi:hypothetical protein